jgi:hypothetical protein
MFTKVFDLISFAGAVQGVLVGAFLFTRKDKHPATVFLAWYILLFSIGLLEPFAVRTIESPFRIFVLSFLSSSNFLYGPLLYLFVDRLVVDEGAIVKRQLSHFAPFAIIFSAEIYFSSTAPNSSVHETFLLIAFELLIIQILFYNIKAIRRLNVDASAQTMKSASQEISWLRSLLVFITAIYVLSFLISHLILIGWKSADTLYLVVQLAITVMIYLMTYRLILHPQLFIPPYSRLGDSILNGTSKYVKSGLKKEQADEYIQQLSSFMATAKPYLDPELSIYTLSQN